MDIRKTLKFICILCLFSVLFLMTWPVGQSFASQANFPLEIINIKPAGTGNPPIPATNRIFRAYPGIEYNIRAAVIGGVYPYHHELRNAPSGMTIDSFTGEIVWQNPQSSAGPITLSVTDSEGTTITTSWSINVTTKGFLFVDASHSGTETGSISQPYSSLTNLIANTSSANQTDIVYLRAGTYSIDDQIYVHQGPNGWIGYPGETVNIYSNGFNVSYGGVLYADNLRMLDTRNYSVWSRSDISYNTVRRCYFDGLWMTDPGTNNNQGGWFTFDEGPGYYLILQDNEVINFGGSGFGSFYNQNKMLIENNYIHRPNTSLPRIIGLGLKSELYELTVRGNAIILPSGYSAFGGGTNSLFWGSSDIDICFNLLVSGTGGTSKTIDGFNHSYPSGAQGKTILYRNTLVGVPVFTRIDGTDCSLSGPWNVENNVIVNSNTNTSELTMHNFLGYRVILGANPWNCVDDINNLAQSDISGILDTDDSFKLTDTYSAYVGIRGWQFDDGSTPMMQPPMMQPPWGLNIFIKQ